MTRALGGNRVERAMSVLNRRGGMAANNDVIMAVPLLLLGVKLIGDAISGL
jgi:hypothetical protein